MTRKKSENNINIVKDTGETRSQIMAEISLEGVLNSTKIILSSKTHEDAELADVLKALYQKSEDIQKGKLNDVERLLFSQSIALDALFTNLTLRAYPNFGEYTSAGETYLRLALKAQSQCRATLETLAEIKNPHPYIQNNKAQYQQVNNGTVRNPDIKPRMHAHAEESFSTNELLEEKTNEQEWLDTRTPTEAIRSD